jgi:vitamin-K-epoxide reductase (warfarin-sensitive)
VRAVGRGSVGQGKRKSWLILDCQPGHFQSIGKAGGRTERLERLRAHWGKEHGIEFQRKPCSARHSKMPLMGRIEASTKEGYAPANERWVHHLFIVTRLSASIRCNMRFLIVLLALGGAIVSALALQVHYSVATEPCSINEKWDCGVVNHSPYAELVGIPVAAIGIAGYLVLAWLALARQRGVTTLVATAALAYSLYLANIERTILGVWCLYCVISLGIIALMTLLSGGWTIAGWITRER